jgi:hypothetical protein
MGAINPYSGAMVASPSGILYLINFVVANALLLASIITIYRIAKKKLALSEGILAQICLVAVNLFIFSITYLTYGAPSFETRYLLPVFIALLFILSEFVASLPDMKLLLPNKTMSVAIFPLLLLLLFVSNLASQMSYQLNNITYYNELLPEIIAKYDCGLVYTGAWGEPGRNLRILDTSTIYKCLDIDEETSSLSFHRWGDYVYYEKPGEYQGKTLLLLKEYQYNSLPPAIQYEYAFQEATGIDGLNIYLADENYLIYYIAQ